MSIPKFDFIDLRAKSLSAAFELPTDSVHIWLAHLDVPANQLQEANDILTQDELERANRFVFAQHRSHFIAARGFLRLILSHYLQIAPQIIRFSYNPFGKPLLATDSVEKPLHFNLSHAKGIALYAFSKQECGIDIESLQHTIDFAALSERFFSANESKALHILPNPEQRAMFFQLWTRKEAYLKAIGQGLSVPLHQFDVSQSPDKPVLHWNFGNGELELSPWYVRNFIPHADYTAAIALKGNPQQISYFHVLPHS